uniref:Helix-turn-helix domain-containing protein n=1 Tax=Thermorudis peleae TaxID=1382356 RepID=A0A831TAV1_9BACT
MHRPSDAEAKPAAEGRWLTIEEASRLLGVGQSTLRRWSDAGKIPVYRTAGGHRRFREADLLGLLRGDTRPRRRMSRKVLTDLSFATYQSETLSRVASRPWYAAYRPEHRAELRVLGRQLVELAFRLISRHEDRAQILASGRAIGSRYGELSAEASLSTIDAVEAFLAFREPVLLAIERFAEDEQIPARRVLRLLTEVNHFLDEVLLATVAAHNAVSSGASGSKGASARNGTTIPSASPGPSGRFAKE